MRLGQYCRSGERPGNGRWSATRGSSATWMNSGHFGPRSWDMPHSDLTLTDEVRAILSVRGKTGEREVVCNKGVERYLDELRSFRTEELGHAPLRSDPD